MVDGKHINKKLKKNMCTTSVLLMQLAIRLELVFITSLFYYQFPQPAPQ